MRLDLATSTVLLTSEAGEETRFPAVGLVCPCHPERDRCEPRTTPAEEREHAWTHALGEIRAGSTWTDRVTGLSYERGFDVYVPLENGTALELQELRGTYADGRPRTDETLDTAAPRGRWLLSLTLVDPWHCEVDPSSAPDPAGWLPQFLYRDVANARPEDSAAAQLGTRKVWLHWDLATEAWAAEHLLRLSRRPAPVRDLSGPACRLLPLAELAELQRAHDAGTNYVQTPSLGVH
jgi:hypothetical protein